MSKVKKPAKKIPKEYGGLVVLTLFSMFIKLFKLTDGELVLASKIIPPILITGAVILVIYEIGYKITRNMRAGLFSATLAAFIPLAGLGEYSTQATITVLFFLFTIFLFSQVEKEKKWPIFLLVPVILALISDCSLYLVVGLLLFYILSKITKYSITDKEAQYIALVGIIILLFSAMANKNPFSLFQTAYIKLIANYLNINKLMSIAGLFPLVFGISGAVLVLIKQANKFGLLIFSNLMAFIVFLVISPLKFNFVLPMFFILLSCLGAVSYDMLAWSLRKSKFSQHTGKIMISLFLIVLYFAVRHWMLFV